ncbi:hypothetical protein B7494_g600 [Chlorociboria aeruginascens]|nr:hypothetical protein B7494_g600 [Chlorociboria aeruginascens]
MSFTKFANEILDIIFADSGLSVKDLCQLSYVDRFLNAKVNQILYRNINTFSLQSAGFKQAAELKTNELLYNTISKHPVLNSFVNSLNIGVKLSEVDATNKLLANLSSLQTLCLCFLSKMQEDPVSDMISSLTQASVLTVRNLSVVNYSEDRLTFDQIENILLRPNLRSFSIRQTGTYRSRQQNRLFSHLARRLRILRFGLTQGFPARRSSVECLHLKGDFFEPGERIEYLLRIIPQLKVLHWFGKETPVEEDQLPLSRVLTSVANNLVELQLECFPEPNCLNHFIDFKSFENLKILAVCQTLLFPGTEAQSDERRNVDKHHATPRNGVYRRLPSTLEILKILITVGKIRDFDFDLDLNFISGPKFRITSDYAWIEELATNKPDYLPNLKHVQIKEALKNPNFEKHVQWDAPPSVVQEYEKHGIGMEFVVKQACGYVIQLGREVEKFS